MDKNIILVSGDDTDFLNEVLLTINFDVDFDIEGYKACLTIENSKNIVKTYDLNGPILHINLDKTITSTLTTGVHKCNIKLIDILGRVRTVKVFEITVKDEFSNICIENINIKPDKKILLVRGDDTDFLNEILLTINFDVDFDIEGYKARLTIENSHKIVKTYDLNGTTLDITLDRAVTSTLTTGVHKCNIKLIDILGRVRTVKVFDIIVENEFNFSHTYSNHFDMDISVTNLIDYNTRITNKPSINSVILEGNKSLEEFGIQPQGDYALKIELQEGLDTKQDKGDYALRQEVADGLDTKQDKGDYALKSDLDPLATKEELEQGLDEKQPKGDYLTEHQDISHLATKEELEDAIENIDLTEFYTKSEVDDLVGNIDVLPDQTDNAGKFLMTDGENLSWEKALTNNATRENYIAIGNNALTTEDEYGSGVSIGANANAHNNSVAVGGYAEANVAGGLAIGNNAKANNFDATTVYDENGIAIGANAMSTNAQAIAIGGDSQSNGVKSIAIGPNSTAKGEGAVVIGSNALSNSTQGANVVIGPNAKINGYSFNSTAIGIGVQAQNYDATVIGRSSTAGAQYSFAAGYGAHTDPVYCDYNIDSSQPVVALGFTSYSRSNSTVAIGKDVYADGPFSIVIGQDSNVNQNNSYGVAIGKEAEVVGSEGIAVGHASNSSRHGIALGTRAEANDFGTITIGLNTVSNSINAVAIGNQSSARGQDSVALGSSAEVANGAGFAVQLGAGTNYDANTLQFRDYKLLYENGIIPYERFSEYTPSNGQVLTYDENEGALVWGEGGGGSQYELPTATSTRLGGVKVGNGLSINSSGVLSANVQDKAEWGNIEGNIKNQTDLYNELQTIHNGVQNLEGDFSQGIRRLEIDIEDTNDRLQSQIDSLSAIGQFLAIWDCDTHNARYLTEGYEYQAGNYFIIGSIATDGGVNYMPNGSSYPGYVETTEDVKVSDMWFYDGVNWIYLANHERAIAIDAELDATSTNPVENKAVAKAIGDLDSLVDIKLDDINVAIEELQNRPTGVGVPQLASVDVLQVKTPDKAQDRYYSYTEWMGQYSDIVVTLNLSKQEILEKMYDLYITISRFKTNKNLNYDDDGEAKTYRNISKFSVMNDFRQKTNIRAYCWRMIYDDSLPETNPARYCYFYTQDLYTSEQTCLENAYNIGLWSNYMGPVSYATCLNAIGWTNGYSANDYLHDYGYTTIGIERYEEGDISEFANLGNAGADYTTKRECREYTRDGQKYFFWCQDWDDRNAEIYNKTDDNDNPLPNAIPVHMDELNYVWNVFDLPSSFEFVKKRPDLNYRAVNDPYAFFEVLEELTFQGKYVDDDGRPTYWNCYWFDYPVMPIMLKDCEARTQFKATKDDYTASVRAGEWHTLEYLYNNNLLHSLSDDLPIELKLPYNTYYLWMRFCSLQKRCAYGDYSNWLDEEGRNIDIPMYPEQKHNLYEGVTSYNVLGRRAFARPRQSYRNNGFSKISETIQFNLCEPMDVASGSKSKATPIQKKLFITSTAKSGLRN